MSAAAISAPGPDANILALALTGVTPLVVMLAWGFVRGGRASVWATMAVVMGSLGILSLFTGEVRVMEGSALPVAVVLGVGAGMALYLATGAFLSLARGWRTLDRHVAELYGPRADVSTAVILVAAGVAASGEELVWRGLFQGVAGEAFGDVAGAAMGWGLYVVANAVSGSLPIMLAAVVGGAVWTALAVWSGGIAASLACHVVWTGLMVALPPVPREEGT